MVPEITIVEIPVELVKSFELLLFATVPDTFTVSVPSVFCITVMLVPPSNAPCGIPPLPCPYAKAENKSKTISIFFISKVCKAKRDVPNKGLFALAAAS